MIPRPLRLIWSVLDVNYCIFFAGARVPGVITAGSFRQEGDTVFWDVHDPEKAIIIELADERYARLVVEVEDPSATVALITRALGPT